MKKIFITFLGFFIAALAGLALDNEFKNILLNIDFDKIGDNAYKVNLVTQIPYVDEIKVVKKSDYNYYILLAETYSKPITKKIDDNLNPVEIQLFPYVEQDLNNGYTKITFNTARPTDFTVSLKAKTAGKFPITDLVRIARLDQMFEQNQTTVKTGKVLVAKATPQAAPKAIQQAQKTQSAAKPAAQPTAAKPVQPTVAKTAEPTVAKAEPKAAPQTQPTLQPVIQPAPEKIAAQPQAKPIIAQPITKVQPTVQPTLQPVIKPQPQPQQPVAKTVLKPEIKPVVKSEVKPVVKPVVKPEVKPVQAEIAPKPVVKPEKPQVQEAQKPVVAVTRPAKPAVQKPVESVTENIVRENTPEIIEEQPQAEQVAQTQPIVAEQPQQQLTTIQKVAKSLQESPLQVALLICSLLVLLIARVQISRIKKEMKTTQQTAQQEPKQKQPRQTGTPSTPVSPSVQPDIRRPQSTIRPKEEIYEEILEENIYQTPSPQVQITPEPVRETMHEPAPAPAPEAPIFEMAAEMAQAYDEVIEPKEIQAEEIIKSEETWIEEVQIEEAPAMQLKEFEIEPEIMEFGLESEITEELLEVAEEPLEADDEIIQPMTISFGRPEINENVFTQALSEPGITEVPEFEEPKPQAPRIQEELRTVETQLQKAAATVTNPQKRLRRSERAEILSSVQVENDRGFFLADFKGVKALVGYILDDIFIIHSFKNQEIKSSQIDFRLSETTKEGDFYLVRVNGSTLLVKSAKHEMALSNFIAR